MSAAQTPRYRPIIEEVRDLLSRTPITPPHRISVAHYKKLGIVPDEIQRLYSLRRQLGEQMAKAIGERDALTDKLTLARQPGLTRRGARDQFGAQRDALVVTLGEKTQIAERFMLLFRHVESVYLSELWLLFPEARGRVFLINSVWEFVLVQLEGMETLALEEKYMTLPLSM